MIQQEVNSLGSSEPHTFWRMLWDYRRFFLLFATAAFALRLFFFFRFPHVTGDSLIYGDIARNWLDHGIFGLTHEEGLVHPTWIRLPGYPAFIAVCFVLFGREHYHAVLLVQIVIDVIACFFIGDLARRTLSDRAGRIAFALAALCPFTANYTVAPLAETLSIFFTVVALDCAVTGFMALDEQRVAWRAWARCGVALAAGILLRPDGGILLGAVGLFLLWRMWKRPEQRVRLFWIGALLLAVSVGPLVPWTIRNWCVFHQFEPLAPRYASDPDEFVPSGFDQWVRTWMVDYVSTEEVYWQVPGSDVDLSLLPARACDNQEDCAQVHAIFDEYAKSHFVGPELNARFAQLASERIARHPVRYYLGLPALRIVDMWLRPRTEMLPLNSRWWEFSDDTEECVIAALYGALNLALVLAAVMGIVRGPRPRYLALMLLFVGLRSAFLGTLENPEPRYTLECYPVVLVLAAAWISGWLRQKPAQAGVAPGGDL